MNYMKNVANLLGVELGEEFAIAEADCRYQIIEKGLYLMYYPAAFINRPLPNVTLEDLLRGKYTIVKLNKEILTDEERKYLSDVIKPWRDKVDYIWKYRQDNYEWVEIVLLGEDYICFPRLKFGEKFKGMELNREYSLKELDL